MEPGDFIGRFTLLVIEDVIEENQRRKDNGSLEVVSGVSISAMEYFLEGVKHEIKIDEIYLDYCINDYKKYL
jgi:hypothetical protein